MVNYLVFVCLWWFLTFTHLPKLPKVMLTRIILYSSWRKSGKEYYGLTFYASLTSILNRPGAVLQIPWSLIHLLIHWVTDPFPPNLQNIINLKQLKHVKCHMSHVTGHFSSFFFSFFRRKGWSLSVEGVLSLGLTPSSLFELCKYF